MFGTGPVFQASQGRSVAKLLTAAKLTQTNCGSARLAVNNPNFITHDGTATAADIQALLALLTSETALRTGKQLTSRLVLLTNETQSESVR
jgi:UDP-N-acetylmuramate dehydrogenase